MSAGYPSSLPALSTAAATRQLPVLVIGAALNTDVVPPEANWKRFTAAAAAGGAPVWELVLRGSAHLQFLDKQQPLFALFSNNGPTPDEVVRQITQVGMNLKHHRSETWQTSRHLLRCCAASVIVLTDSPRIDRTSTHQLAFSQSRLAPHQQHTISHDTCFTPASCVTYCVQTAMVSFTQLAVCPPQPYSSSQVQTLLAEEAGALQKLAPLDSSFKNFSQLRTSSAGGSTDSYTATSSSSRARYSGDSPQPRQQAAAGVGGASRAKPVQANYGQLMQMRVKELKRLLQEHGVDSSDCFEKEELVKRVLERCTAAAQA
jgi:hypothetical protein